MSASPPSSGFSNKLDFFQFGKFEATRAPSSICLSGVVDIRLIPVRFSTKLSYLGLSDFLGFDLTFTPLE
jgi:hypothetical protein